MKKLLFFFLGILLLTSCSPTQKEGNGGYDIVIYGGTSAGVVAAVQASRLGKSTILIEPGRHLGGLTSGGLGRTDSGDKSVIGGISREFYQSMHDYYSTPEAWIYEKPSDYQGYDPDDDAIWGFEPGVAEMIYERMLEEENVEVLKGERLDLEQGVNVENNAIKSIKMESELLITGKIFIDATYEGDLMALSGVSYTIGRESNQTYGETLNGVQKKMAVYHQFVDGVDPYVIAGDPSSGILPGVHGDDPGSDGEGDKRIQAYCFRMCLTDIPENMIPYPKPRDYDEKRYELLLRNFDAGEDGMPWLPGLMPNRKTDTNNRTGFSTDYIGMNYDYPEADYSTREKITRDHETYQKGLMWTLANNSRVPEHIRTEIGRWGLARDEFKDNDNWPHQLYIRESRRMLGEYVVTEKDCRRQEIVPDPIGLGSYTMDSHHCQRYINEDGFVKNEGDVEVSPGGAYLISYRSITPRKDEITNLLVPVCLSASHIAYGSIRMEPVFMILGHSAATAASLAAERGTTVQDVDYKQLRTLLLRDLQVLDLPEGVKEEAAGS